jgi:hypothetical protein
MVGRVELALSGLLGLALILGLNNQQQILRAKSQAAPSRKEAELLDAHVREVNRTTVMNAFSAAHAVMIRQTWYMDRFSLHNPDIRSLRADRAVRNDRQIRLEGNVTLLRSDGSVYEARKVLYELKKKILKSSGPFYAYKGEDYARGIDFVYEVTPQITRAKKVFAHYRLRGDERTPSAQTDEKKR